jgi:Spy/CpxP family protein refolding chaperone
MHRMLGLAAVGFAITTFAQTTPYAGEQHRQIKSLSTAEVADLLAGQGLGLAKAAELNGYPGPAHVFEHAETLALTPDQKQASKSVMERHKERARQLGAALVASERRLDSAFATREIDAVRLSQLTGEIGNLQAQLREEHLRTHLAQTALLSADQVRQYGALRGYGEGSAPAAHPRQH